MPWEPLVFPKPNPGEASRKTPGASAILWMDAKSASRTTVQKPKGMSRFTPKKTNNKRYGFNRGFKVVRTDFVHPPELLHFRGQASG